MTQSWTYATPFFWRRADYVPRFGWETPEYFERRLQIEQELLAAANGDADQEMVAQYEAWENAYESRCGEHEDGWWCPHDTRVAFMAGWRLGAERR